MDISKGFLKTGRFLIPYRLYGNKGEYLVCLNGVQQSMAMWHSVIRRFSAKFRILLFDFPTQGKSRALSGPINASVEEQIEILKNVLKAAGVNSNIILCSASWGGVIAAAFAARYPQAVKRLILASLGTRPNKKMIETIKKGGSIDPRNRQQMADTLIKSFGQNLPSSIKEKIVAQFRAMSKENLQAFYQHGLFVMETKHIGEIVNLKNIKAETILINGADDTIIDLKDVTYLAAQIPNCQIRIVKNAGHFLHLERPDILNLYEELLNVK